MRKLFKYLKESKWTACIIIALLVAQAVCDLALPQYISKIVDIGIQQSGIENSVPVRLRASAFDDLSLFMNDEDTAFVKQSYEVNTDGIYVLTAKDKGIIEELNDIFAYPIVALSVMKESGQITPDAIRSMLAAGQLTKQQLIGMRDQAIEQFRNMGDSFITQKTVLFLKSEYEAAGLDLGKIQTDYLLLAGVKMLGISVAMMSVSIVVGLLASRTAAKVGKTLRRRVFSNVVSFSSTEMDRFSTASLITRSTNDIQQVQMVTFFMLRMVSYAPILGIGGVIKAMSSNTGLSWIIGVAVGTVILIVAVLMNLAMPKFKKMQTLVDNLNLVARETLTGISVIRAFSREKHEERRFEFSSRSLMKTQLFANRVMMFMMPLMMLVMNAITLLIVWVGSQGVDVGNLQVGDMMAFITYTMQIVMSFLMLSMVSVMLPRAGVAAARIDEVLETKCSIRDKEVVEDEKLLNAAGVVAFEDVSFRYADSDKDVIEHIDFTAQPGQITAIIGSTGSGKSTILNLIPRFFDVSGGRITVDGIDIRDLSQHRLRSLLGYVPQRGVLFSGDIESNLKFGGEDISDADIEKAAEIAQAEEFISSKPEQYQSEIAQGGTNVSGGQKQRLSIARAIAKNPKIFLFDDSFSALDYKTDVALRRALSEELSDATVLIVAQRISTILHAEQIIVMDEGRISGIGNHAELLKTCPTYQEIARSQLSEEELKGVRRS